MPAFNCPVCHANPEVYTVTPSADFNYSYACLPCMRTAHVVPGGKIKKAPMPPSG